ncbi:MAG: uncharacterized protein A8A55_1282, partial [Amphiamblys sp. WSBS2006]
MAEKYLKHLLFFLAADESTVDAKRQVGYVEADYEKLGLIGSGYFGIVSKIKEKKTGKIYALKTQKKDDCYHATKEINALKQLDHENIVKMIANNTKNRHSGDLLCIVLEH